MIKLFLDSDMGPDCDDAGALAIINNLINRGECELLGITHSTSDYDGNVTISAINSWFGNDTIPIGRYEKNGFLSANDILSYTPIIAKKFLETHSAPQYDGAVKVMRRTLAKQNDVTLVGIGPLNNIANLLKSAPDEYDSRNGVDFFKAHISRVVLMGGWFSADAAAAEFNIRCDIDAAHTVCDMCPSPIIYCGFEAAVDVLTGYSLSTLDDDYPVKEAYMSFGKLNKRLAPDGTFRRPSWDLLTVYYAVRGTAGLLCEEKGYTISFDDKGYTVYESNGKDSYLVKTADKETIAEALEELIQP